MKVAAHIETVEALLRALSFDIRMTYQASVDDENHRQVIAYMVGGAGIESATLAV